ncbi:copper-translocating P-type ATPase [Companilactobacillus sp.]|jgi:Cu+-exporting ATPase|uniref:copper-translocating P-type ATPase n=1 Tax=Companilactobacillus sp. TaxID=2767905 RepID=UPI0025C5B307|nr:copper-translocating P-type ATPase [Companilactobacillus sp.]MCH4009401.1 copper-translocating P-type ATPase [Companilactobacillus sp.]MCH4050420.1 copper-translocating P-type ATPase [Companilactobacillus sp.]MCH4077343.1 copper-translocating P-type ATPase [Companilactobacillus sp.]MCH4125919.1 copper-translocating P-type ATPase [Companilactobacillus sp.]MCI1311628.1 copper-translocating P-type ATPase [Companilactobacillus sp.]
MSITKRFWISLLFSLPMLANMILMPFGWMMPGGNWTQLALTTVIMWISARPFWQSAWASFTKHHSNMDTLVAIGTVTAYLYSIYAMATHQAVFFESAAFVTTFVLLGQVFEERMRNNASNAVEKLVDLQAKDAEVMRDGKLVKIPLSEVVVGDIIRVKPGQKVAVDGVITEGTSTIDESMVTGESMPVEKKAGDKVIGSTINSNGTFMFKAEKVGNDTMLSQIVDLVKKAQNSHAPIQNLTDKVSDIFVPVVLIIAILTFMIWYVFLDASVANSLIFAVSVVVIACPCALGLATPTALMVGTGRSAKMGILIKNGEVLEAVNEIKTVVFDKTGTITVGKPEVTDIVGNEQEVLSVATGLEQSSEHPLASAIVKKSESMNIKTPQVADFKAIEGKGVEALINGKKSFVGNDKLLDDVEIGKELEQQVVELQEQAKTVVFVGVENQVVGLIAIQDAPKETSKEAIADLKARGLKTVMLTGDNQRVAEAIAKQVGIDEVIADVLPSEKADHVKSIQESGKVAFVGDGINDAPALTVADVGIAMGSGTDIAIESGGIVLVKNDLRDVDKALALSKKTFNRIKLNLFWAFIYNVLGIPVAAGIFFGIGLTLSPELAGLAMAFSSLSVVTSSMLLNKARITSKAKAA